MIRQWTIAATTLALGVTGALAQSSSTSMPPAPAPNSPYAEIREVPQAAAAAAAARATYRKAQGEIHYAILSLQMNLEQSTEWRSANLALDRAHRQYAHARDRVLTAMENDPEYRRLQATEGAYALMIVELKRTPDPHPQTLLDLAQQRMAAGSAVNAVEAAALEQDQDFTAARSALVAANDTVLTMRHSMERSVRQDPHWQQARAALVDSKVQVAATSAYLNRTVEARNIAVNFAAYQVGQLRYRPIITEGLGYDGYSSNYRLGYPIYWHGK